MKTSVIIIALIFLNTTALIAEPLASLFKNVNPWIFITIETLLVMGYFVNHIIKDLNRVLKLDFNNINLFVVKSKHKKAESA